MPSLRERIDADFEFLKSFRHDLHQHPELSYEEMRTSQRVVEELSEIGIVHVSGLAKGTGIVGWLPATKPGGKTIALRADMDALPIHEETGVPYASKVDGKMHACGHDGHTTILLGVARALRNEEDRLNNIIFVFQPAEEGGAGGKAMCEDGALNGTVIGEPADCIFGLHGWPARPQGQFSTKPGPVMASTDQFFVTVRGRGGHAAAPELSSDSVLAAAQMIVGLQSLVSRNVPPVESAVLSVTMLSAGTATNIIPEHVEFAGTIRTLNDGIRALMRKRFYESVEGMAASMGVTVDIRWEEGYPVTVNDEWATSHFFNVAERTFGERVNVEPYPKLGAEDFSFYGHYVPAAFYFVGLQRPGETDSPGLHTPRFDFNDNVICDCVEMMCRLALAPVVK